MSNFSFNVVETDNVPIKAWTKGVPVEVEAIQQVKNLASLPFIHKHVALMPDVHVGIGATIGSVIATKNAIIPAAVGVDIGCGMNALKTNLTAEMLPDSLAGLRSALEAAIPHGRTNNGGVGDRGSWGEIPEHIQNSQSVIGLHGEYEALKKKTQAITARNSFNQIGTLGGGNHFVEICLDENKQVWVMLHSGSRGAGNKIGQHFITEAKKEMEKWFISLPDKDLAYLPEGSKLFNDYVEGVNWAQKFAATNREIMMQAVIKTMNDFLGIEVFGVEEAISCHHNYVNQERHFGENVFVTRKGAVSAKEGQLGIIPGSMGARSFIVEGKGNRESFCSCSHGAGRVMSRTEANKRFTVADHELATAGVECRKDEGVIDETPAAYKNIDDVMAAQADLISVKYILKQILCIKG